MRFTCPICRVEKESVMMKELPQGVILFCDRGHSVMVERSQVKKSVKP